MASRSRHRSRSKSRDRESGGVPPQLDVQDARGPDPGDGPLVLVAVDGVDVGHAADLQQAGLLGGLAVEEAGRGRRQDDPHRQVRVPGEGLQHVGQLDARHGPAAGDEQPRLGHAHVARQRGRRRQEAFLDLDRPPPAAAQRPAA